MFKGYAVQLKNEFKGYNGKRLSKDVMSGITVAAVALPLALAFGVSCGANAAAGLITAIIAGIVIGALSGASFQISGPTGAMSAVLIAVIAKNGLQGVFIVGVIAGVIMLLAGILKLGKLVSLISMPVITGFTSGIAVIIALGQIDNFFGVTSEGSDAVEKLFSYGKLGFSPNFQAFAIGAIVILIMIICPKKLNARVPSSLVAIIIATVISTLLNFDIAVVGKIPNTLLLDQRLNIMAVDWTRLQNYMSSAVTVAALGMIESLLCGASASRMKNSEFNADRELIAQGIGNIILPFFGGVPATAAIARTSVAIKSGCETRLTGIFHAVVLLLSMFLLGPVMSRLPLSALAGVLIVTAFRMNEWNAMKYFFKRRFKGAILQFSVTLAATVIFDLTIAIMIGVIVCVFTFLLSSVDIHVSKSYIDNERLKKRLPDADADKTHPGTMMFYITGALFFANTDTLLKEIDGIIDVNEIIFSFRGVTNLDSTAAHVLIGRLKALEKSGITVRFSGVIEKVKTVLVRAGIYDVLDDSRFYPSVDKAILIDTGLYKNNLFNNAFSEVG